MTWQNSQVIIYISFLFFSFLLSWTYYTEGSAGKYHITCITSHNIIMPDSCLGNKSDIFHYNNENNQLKRQVWPLRDVS